MESENVVVSRRVPWNKGKLTGQKPPLRLREIWPIRMRLQMASNVRELALFNLAIDSKLPACDLMRLQVQDVRHGSHVAARATVIQQKAQRPVQFEITEQTRESLEAWIKARGLKAEDFLFPSRLHTSPHLSTRQYARMVHRWVDTTVMTANQPSSRSSVRLRQTLPACCRTVPARSGIRSRRRRSGQSSYAHGSGPCVDHVAGASRPSRPRLNHCLSRGHQRKSVALQHAPWGRRRRRETGAAADEAAGCVRAGPSSSESRHGGECLNFCVQSR